MQVEPGAPPSAIGGSDAGAIAGAALEERVDFLRHHSPWRGLDPGRLAGLAASFREVSHEDGAWLLHQGDSSGELHVLVSGRFEVRVRTGSGAARTIAMLDAGACVGEMSLLTGDMVSADVLSAGPTRTLVLGREQFEALVSTEPRLLREFIRLLSDRVRARGQEVGEAQQRGEDLAHFIRAEKSGAQQELIGTPKTVKALKTQIDKLAPGSLPIFIHGERGTGKEVVGQLVHLGGARPDGPLLAVDCTQIIGAASGDNLFGAAEGPGGQGASLLCRAKLASGGTLLLADVEALPRVVQERLAAQLRSAAEGQPRFDVRVVAQSSATLATLGSTGQLIPELAAAFAGREITVPPLRERKKDIPLLANHFVARMAARLQRTITGLTDEAMTKLVSLDYRTANVGELKTIVERAVVLTGKETVGAEEIFKSDPPAPHHSWVMLSRGALKRFVRYLPRAVRPVVAVCFAAVLALCLAGAATGYGALATTLVWSLWWPSLVLSFFLFGRAWCSVCPMALLGEGAQRVRAREHRIPTWLKNHDAQVMAGGFFAIVTVEQLTDMRHSPLGTGLLLLTIGTGAVLTSVSFARRTWCRHLCPLGGFGGVCALSSVIELRPAIDICSVKCAGHACYKGTDTTPGCPMFGHVMFLETNAECVLCMNCVRSCPNESPRINLRPPAQELWTGPAPRPSLVSFVGMLLGLLVAMAVLQRLEASAPAWFASHGLAIGAGLLALGAGLPLLLLALAAKRLSAESSETLRRQLLGFAPLVTSGFFAYHLSEVPGFAALQLALSSPGHGAVSVPVLALSQAATLVTGLAVTGLVLRKLATAPGKLGVLAWVKRDLRLLVPAAAWVVVVGAIMVR